MSAKDQVADAIFFEASKAVLEDTDDETAKRVAALLSMYAPRLAQAAIDALQLTKERVPMIPPRSLRYPSRLVGPWVEGER